MGALDLRRIQQHRTSDAAVPAALARAMIRAGLGPVFHAVGELTLCDEAPRIAIIGTRNPSLRCAVAAEELATLIALEHATVVSGGATGIDDAAHRGALAAGGRTIVVAPGGIPLLDCSRWRTLLAHHDEPGVHALFVSPFPVHQVPTRQTPVIRNRLTAALADLVVVGEARAGSGTYHCVRAAVEMGIPLHLLAATEQSHGDADLPPLHQDLARRGARFHSLADCSDPTFARSLVAAARASRALQQAAERSQLSLFGEADL